MTPAQCHHSSQQICEHLARLWQIKRAKRIAFYFPAANEVDLFSLIEFAWAANKEVYLPVLGLRYTGQLWFVPYAPADELYLNRFGIPEPVHDKRHRRTKLQNLDILLMPLVAFDHSGNRVGMGGGFYDRTLANLHTMNAWQRPKRIGVAYRLQQVEHIAVEKWDIPLHAIATEDGVSWFKEYL